MVVRENFSPSLRPCSTLIFKVFLGLDYVFGAAWRRGTKETWQQSDFVEEVWSTPPCKLRWTVKVGRKKVARIPHGLRQDSRRLGKPWDLIVRRPVKEQTAVYRGPLGLQGQESESAVAQFSSVQSLSRVRLSATPWIAARQASLSITNSWSLLKLMPIESVMPSIHLILCRPLLLLPPIPPSIKVFSSESTLRMKWPKYWSFSFKISPSSEHPGLSSFRMDWLDLLAVQFYTYRQYEKDCVWFFLNGLYERSLA